MADGEIMILVTRAAVCSDGYKEGEEVVKLIEDARSEGLNIQANVYPYTRGNNNQSGRLM